MVLGSKRHLNPWDSMQNEEKSPACFIPLLGDCVGCVVP
jgi:hypothetical protein